jgi:mannose-6-phosphate isomerase
MSLDKFYRAHREFFGNYLSKQYPLLVKFLDCNDKLSIQVHPKSGINKKNEA